MAVGILLITHEGIGASLLAVATRLLRQLPLRAEAFEVPFDADPDALLPAASSITPMMLLALTSRPLAASVALLR